MERRQSGKGEPSRVEAAAPVAQARSTAAPRPRERAELHPAALEKGQEKSQIHGLSGVISVPAACLPLSNLFLKLNSQAEAITPWGRAFRFTLSR